MGSCSWLREPPFTDLVMLMRPILTTILELVGLATASVGVFLIDVPAGLVFAGLCAVLVGVAEGRK